MGNVFSPLSGTCANLNATYCNLKAHTNISNIPDSAKLNPNDDVAGPKILWVFLAVTAFTILLCFALAYDEWHCVIYDREHQGGPHKRYPYTPKFLRDDLSKHYHQVIHTICRLLHKQSEALLLACYAIIVVVFLQRCTLSAYHYNLVCTLLLMGIISQVNILWSVPNYLFDNQEDGALEFNRINLVKFALIIPQLLLSMFIIGERDRHNLPIQADSLAILPGSCFNTFNITAGSEHFANSTLNSTSPNNATQITLSQPVTSKGNLRWDFICVAVYCCLGAVSIIYEFYMTCYKKGVRSKRRLQFLPIIVTVLSSIASAVVTIIAAVHFTALRAAMEVPNWYKTAEAKPWTLSELMFVFSCGGAAFVVLEALGESFAGKHGHRWKAHFNESKESMAYSFGTANSAIEGTGAGKISF